MTTSNWFWDDPQQRAAFNAVAAEILPPPAAGKRALTVAEALHVRHVADIPTGAEAIARLRAWQQRHLEN